MVAEEERDVPEKVSDKESVAPEGAGPDTFWGRHGANIGLAVLILYVILLAIGTIAEIFDIDAILNWWIFRPPGR